jgi:hypothetical protein
VCPSPFTYRPPLGSLLEDLTDQARLSLQEHLQHLAEAAELLPPDDPLWNEMAQPDGDGLRTYVAGCCIRLHVRSDLRQVVVEQIGRIRLRLSSSALSFA